jgi:hypothetical protein
MSQIVAEIYGTLEVSIEGASSTITVEIGTPGPAASVTVGTTTTLSPGASASVTNVGTTAAATLNFGIPAGQTGATGSQGPAGNAATVAVGTVTTLSPGASATVTNVGTSAAAVFNYGIPQGAVGSTGSTGATGATGAAGPGVAVGGTTGQFLSKASGTDYDTAWSTIVPGDRYLTSSTTSLTINNADKTLTIGTGLSYSPQQDLVISETSNPTTRHMHARVTSYNSGTGVMVVNVISNTGSGTYSSWVVNVGGATPAASTAWGSITGTLSAQTDLQTALDAKAPLASPALTGTPTAPTATAGTSTTQLATTAFVTAVDVLKAPIASPTFTGVPAAPTATAGTNTTQLATTAFVTNGLSTKANLASPTFTGTVTIPAGASISGFAPLASPALTGTPTAPTASTVTNSTQIATTAFVKAQAYATLASPTFTGTVTIPAGASITGYLTTASAASTYQTLSGMSSYLTTSTAASTYQTLSGMSSYLTTSAAASTYQPIGSYLTDAPSDGNEYVRKNAAWAVASAGGGVAWGAITGTLSSQTDLQTALDAKLALAGGTMTGGLTLSATGIIFSDATTMTTAPAGSTLAADQLTAGVVTANPTTGPTTAGDVLEYNGTALVWAAGGGGGGLTISSLSNGATSTLDATVPTTGYVLSFDGTNLVWAAGGGGGVAWGGITGTVTDQTDLVSYISGLGYLTSIPAKTITTYTNSSTITNADCNNIIYVSSFGGMGVTLTADTDSLASYPTPSEITVVWDLANTSGINASSGVTINGGASVTITNAVSKLVKVATNTWFYT